MRMYKNPGALIISFFLAGCTAWVKDEVSHPVSNGEPDYGVVPSTLPRNAHGLPRWALPFIRNFELYGISAYFEISNTIKIVNGRIESKGNEPLVVKISIFIENSNNGVLIKNIKGDLFLLPNKILHPIEMYVQPGSFCSSPPKAEIVDLHDKEIMLVQSFTEERVFHAIENFKVIGKKITAVNACMVFSYAEPVPVTNVFKIDFAKVVLANGEMEPLIATFYPVVRDYIEK